MTILPTNEFGFTFASIHSRNYNIRVVEIRRNIFAEPTENEQTVPGKKGTVYFGTSIGHRIIQIDIKIIASSHQERNDIAHDIANWLMDSADQDDELIFDDESDKDYYGHFATNSTIIRSLYNGVATIEFHCSDPFAYKEQVDTSVYTSSPATVPVSSQVSTHPIINVQVNQPITYLALTNSNDDFLYLGSPEDPDQGTTTQSKETSIFHDSMTSMVPWQANSAQNYINGTIAGQYEANNYALFTGSSDYGSGSSWHGPSLKQFFGGSQQLQDFRVSAWVSFKSNNYASMGVCRIYLIDANNNSLGYICLKDNSDDPFTIFQCKAGTEQNGHDVCYTGGYHWELKKKISVKKKVNGKWHWFTEWVNADHMENKFNDFYGVLSVSRIGNIWTAIIIGMNSVQQEQYRFTYTWTDKANAYTAPKLAGLAIYNAAYDTKPVMDSANAITDLTVYQENIAGWQDATQIPIIAGAGDEIMIDCEAHKIMKNGSVWMDELLIGSQFFEIQPGTEVIGFAPADKVNLALSYRPKYM